MNTKNILKTLALAMLLIPACNKSEIANEKNKEENTEKKGFALPVTVNVTREGDDATKATYNETSKKLEFSAGDKLFVYGSQNNAGKFAGTLDYDAVSGKFSGTMTTENEYTGTIDNLMETVNAFLLPAGYESYGFYSVSGSGYEATVTEDDTKAFALTKAAAVEQFSYEFTIEYNSGFALAPMNAIVSFTISGLTANKEVAVSFNASGTVISGKVTTNATGVATFAVGVYLDCELENCTLTVDGNNIAMPTKTTEAGHIYNITRNAIPGALIGQFSVSSTDKVYFSKGNLQYTKSTGIWSFMDHQYSTVETTSQAIGDDYASQDVVSLFGWGTSGWNNGNTYYQPYNTAYVNSSSKGYGYGPTDGSSYTYNLTGTYANADWGLNNAISNGGNTAGTWRTLTKDEWEWLLGPKTSPNPGTNCRTSSTVNGTANARYAKAYLFGTTHGVIIFPDSYTHPAGVTAPTGINATGSTSWSNNRYTATDWAKMEAAGCVFLPAAGRRDDTSIYNVNAYLRYWTSTYYNAGMAHSVSITDNNMNPADYNYKYFGYSVRLVHDAN